ncbi:MAG: helix-turn-helix domain-containing protein [Myxococcota bacterium]
MFDLVRGVAALLDVPAVRDKLTEIIRKAVKHEFSLILCDEMIGVREAARVLGMTEAAVRQHEVRGNIKGHRFGAAVRFRRSELLRIRER